MVLEYSNLPLFHELNQWQAAEKGVPSKLKALESEALKERGARRWHFTGRWARKMANAFDAFLVADAAASVRG